MNKKSLNIFAVLVFVFTFALAFQIAVGGPGGGEVGDCCYEPCVGIGLGDYGHLEENFLELDCDCSDPLQLYSQCTHTCNTCGQ